MGRRYRQAGDANEVHLKIYKYLAEDLELLTKFKTVSNLEKAEYP